MAIGWEVWAAIGVVVAVVLVWKLMKGLFKLAIVVGVAILIFLGLRQFNVLLVAPPAGPPAPHEDV